ncbi:hypothetical protein AB0C28_49075 [Nonomuraea sp. NPDC048892]|uniref:hypothetical protein n=1 Tax=Nonomuraea sp. NPDC048892 TaxID=3154624 RepID=UPI0033F285DA
MDQFLEDLPPNLRMLVLTMRRVADESRKAWLDDQEPSRAGRDINNQEDSES